MLVLLPKGELPTRAWALMSPLGKDSLSWATLRLQLLLEIGAPSTLPLGGNRLSAVRVYFAELCRRLQGRTASDSRARPTEGMWHGLGSGACLLGRAFI